MSSTYNGKVANVSMTATSSVQKTTAATPATVVTFTPHGLSTGDYAHIKGEVIINAINGIWPVTVIDALTFTIPTTSTISSATGGTVQPLKLAAAQVPSDGDAATASSIDTPAQAELDQSAFLGAATGAWKNAGMQPVGSSSWQNDSGTPPTGIWLTISPTANAFKATG
jgi:hypothetical protein